MALKVVSMEELKLEVLRPENAQIHARRLPTHSGGLIRLVERGDDGAQRDAFDGGTRAMASLPASTTPPVRFAAPARSAPHWNRSGSASVPGCTRVNANSSTANPPG